MSSSNNTVPPDVAARQHLDRIIQEGQARRGRRFNLPDLHAFFHKRLVERRRPAEEEYDPDVASSSAQDSQEADILEGADTPEFSLFGHIYPDIPDSDSDSSTGEYYMAQLPLEAVSGEFTPVLPNTEPTDIGPAAQGTAGSDPTSVPTTTEASVVDNSTASIPASDSTEWLLFDLGPEEALDPSNPEGYDSDWEKMVIDVNTSANQGAVSTDHQGTTTSLCSHLSLERQTFLHAEPDLSPSEPFPEYCEPFEGDAAQAHEEIEQAYSYALSKVAEESIRSEEMSHRHPIMVPMAARAPHPPNAAFPHVNPEFRPQQGPSAWPRTPVRPRNPPSFVPDRNTPTRARYLAQSPPSYPTVVSHSMRSSEALEHASSSTTSPRPNDPASVTKRLTQEAVRVGRLSTADKKNVAFHAMTEMLLDSEINDELRSRFSALSNDVLRLELDIFQTLEASIGNFLGPTTITLITPIANAFIDYLGFLGQTLQKEARDAQAVKAAVVNTSADRTGSAETRFRNMIRPILRNLKRPRPSEHRLLHIFIDLFDSYVYSDFLIIYNYMVIRDTVLYNERMAASHLLISIWSVLQRTVGNYKAIMMVNDELKSQFISPAMGTVANYKAIWDDENAIYQREIDGGLRGGV